MAGTCAAHCNCNGQNDARRADHTPQLQHGDSAAPHALGTLQSYVVFNGEHEAVETRVPHTLQRKEKKK